MANAGGHRSALARARRVLQQPDFRHALRARRAHHLAGPVRAAVVHEDLLERVLASQRRVNFLRQRQDVLVLVADGYDDGDGGCRGRRRIGGHGRKRPAVVVYAAAACGGRRVVSATPSPGRRCPPDPPLERPSRKFPSARCRKSPARLGPGDHGIVHGDRGCGRADFGLARPAGGCRPHADRHRRARAGLDRSPAHAASDEPPPLVRLPPCAGAGSVRQRDRAVPGGRVDRDRSRGPAVDATSHRGRDDARGRAGRAARERLGVRDPAQGQPAEPERSRGPPARDGRLAGFDRRAACGRRHPGDGLDHRSIRCCRCWSRR